MRRDDPRFRTLQRDLFEQADEARFRWTTGAPGFAETEDALLAWAAQALASPCLEVGCGEGNNLLRFAPQLRCTGVDLFAAKLRFAAGQVRGVRFAGADAAALPFADASFGSVFIRDLLHHVPDPAAVIAEAARVLRPGGRLCVLEPNGANPLVMLQTWVVPAERGARESRREALEQLLRAAPFDSLEISAREPLPLRRLVLHYRFGLPALGRAAFTRSALATLESWLGRALPRSRWSVLAALARRV